MFYSKHRLRFAIFFISLFIDMALRGYKHYLFMIWKFVSRDVASDRLICARVSKV